MNVFRIYRTDSAVSPVIGVLLMLIVTIIIAAVVSGFARGLAGDNKAAPAASIDAQIDTSADDGYGGTKTSMQFEMLSGDAIPSKDLEIVTYFTNSSGYVYKSIHNATSPKCDLYGYGTDYARLPWLNDVDKTNGYAGSAAKADFGNYTWSTGDIIVADSARQVADFLGLPWTAGTYPDPDTINEEDFTEGASVEVTIMHVPSHKTIFSKEVIVK